ncbi:MATE family efflux transporter [Methanobrevibacter sp.]|uniref:MATE family efflux transporter n=1 Tax=Methanobrevibacter sp. TaxID=66852 RepID=UPI00386C6248
MMYERRYDLLKSKFNEFLLPTLLTAMANNICIFSDALIVSFLVGSFNLAAIQVVVPVVTFVNLIYWAIGMGGSVLMSSAKAEYDDFKSNAYFTVSIISLIIFGIVFAALGLIFIDPISGFLCTATVGGGEQLYPLVKDYLAMTLLGIPFMCYMMSMSYFTRADGMPKMALIAVIITNLVNIAMDFIYIQYLGMGIGGAALATVTGDIAASVFISYYFLSGKRTLKLLSISKIKFNQFTSYLKDIFASGFPPASIQLFITLKLFIINYLIQIVIGGVGLVAFSVCDNVSFLIYMFAIGISQTMAPIVTVYYQEEDYVAVKYTIKRAIKLALISSAILMAIFIIYPQALLFLFSIKNPSQIPVVTEAIRLYSLSFMGLVLCFVMTYYAESIKRDKYSFMISIIEGFIVPVGVALLLIPLMGSNGIWIAFLIAEIVAIIFMFIYSKYIERKSNGEYSGFFLLKEQDKENMLDLSVNGDLKEITDLAKQVQDYLRSLSVSDLTSTRVSLAIEEMLVNIVNTNDDVGMMDVLIKIQSEHILISIKDQGVEFNPTIQRDGHEFDNINVLKDISDKIDYARVLGLNSTVITIKK